MVTLTSPKQQPTEQLKDWYLCFAGFTSAFVSDVFDSYLQSANFVVDPWNGTGTTTAIATQKNIRSMGIDVNPALSIVARARQLPKSLAPALIPIATEITDIAKRTVPTQRECEPLSDCMGPTATNEIRKFQRAIHMVTATDDNLEIDLSMGDELATSRLPLLTAFFYTVLFAVAVDLLRRFRGSNPTWIVAPSSHHRRLRPSAAIIRANFFERTGYLCSRLHVTKSDPSELANIRMGRALDMLSYRHSFDACLASPPYATRIDYIKCMLPELAKLGLSAKAIADLRQHTTGTPIVRGVHTVDSIGNYCLE